MRSLHRMTLQPEFLYPRRVLLSVSGVRGRNHDRGLRPRPAGEARRHRLTCLHHLGQGVEAPTDQDVGGVADAVRELVVGSRLRLRRQLTLFGDASVGDLRLVLVEAPLRVVVVADEGDRDAQHIDPTGDPLTHVREHIVREVPQIGEALGVLRTHRVERVELAQHGVEGGVELPCHYRVTDPVHVPVVAVQLIALAFGDPPTDRVVHAGGRLVADPDVRAPTVELTTTFVGVGVGLDARIELRDLLPRPLEVDAVAQRVGGPAEAGHHADTTSPDNREAAENEEDDGKRHRNTSDELGGAGAIIRLGNLLADQRHDHDQDGQDHEHEKPWKGHRPSFLSGSSNFKEHWILQTFTGMAVIY